MENKNQPKAEVTAAIAMALYELQQSQQRSGARITLGGHTGQPARSPWSSKILTLRKLPGQY